MNRADKKNNLLRCSFPFLPCVLVHDEIYCGMLMLYVGSLTEVTCDVYGECSVELKPLKMPVNKRIVFDKV